jgi:MYXO-CTERM domain-containing protein
MHKPTLIAVSALLLSSSALAAGSGSSVTIDASHDRRPISPEIYGLMLGDDAQLSRMGVTVRRHGGNELTRYNWKTSTTNTGGDGKFFKIKPMEVGAGYVSSADSFIARTKAAGARSIIELPLAGYVSNPLGAAHCGFSVSKYGVQKLLDPTDADCGNGELPNGAMVPNDPHDVSVEADAFWSREWLTHLVAIFGNASSGGVKYYNLGNQPALWHETHRDIHPARSSYAEIKQKLEAHGRAVKEIDPTALTLGPGAWGWLEYFDSAAGDRASSGIEFIPFYLKTAKDLEGSSHHRILDYLDIHIYPQATGVTKGDLSDAVNALRLRSTRILWDPTYTVESWETCCNGDGVLNILPRMREWIAAYYPGTRLAISGYAFGAIDSPSGALAQVDALGIFGREGVDLAALEDPPKPDSIGEDAFKLFRNYDGKGAHFGDTSVRATSSALDALAAFAAFDASGHLTVVLINKDPALTNQAVITFKGTGETGSWRAFEFGASGRLAAAGNGNVAGGVLNRAVPPYTATLIEFTPTDGIGPEAVDEPDAGGVTKAAPPAGCGCSSGGAQWLVGLSLLPMIRRRRHTDASCRTSSETLRTAP